MGIPPLEILNPKLILKLIATINPGVEKLLHYLTGAMAWSAVGLSVDFHSAGWLRCGNSISRIFLFACRLVLAAAVYPVIYKPFTDQCIARIRAVIGERIDFFAIQP